MFNSQYDLTDESHSSRVQDYHTFHHATRLDAIHTIKEALDSYILETRVQDMAHTADYYA